jgi:phosphoribosylanthranilate isomerase
MQDAAPGTPVLVKICGLTRPEDAALAVELGADALGLNTFPGSRRFVDLRAEEGWLRELPASVCRVAVMVNPPRDEVARVLALPFIDMVQLHGDEDEEFCAALAGTGAEFIKAIRVGDGSMLETLAAYGTRRILLDAMVKGQYGGTGRTFDWELADEARRRHPGLSIYISGGLNPGNVASAVSRVRPFAVDVAGGVESSPGVKDPVRMRDFIQAARGL